MIAFHFPPMKGSSGLQRTLSFANHLASAGWDVTVLTVRAWAYENTSDDQLADIDPRIQVIRCLCFDAERQLAYKGKYFRFTAYPDRWGSWIAGGFVRGCLAIVRRRPDVIWSTYPIATAHRLANWLSTAFSIPHVADFRDQMIQGDHYPDDPEQRKAYRKIEQRVTGNARLCVFTAPGTLMMYRDRYGYLNDANTALIENGYDGRYFQELGEPHPLKYEPVILLHSGILYPEERDPSALFDALRELKHEGALRTEVWLRSPGSEALFASMLADRGLTDEVKLKGSLPYREALQEMLSGCVLLVMQHASCNHQIPAKLYEYIAARQPIFALTPSDSDTAQVFNRAGGGYLADIDDRLGIKEQILRLQAEVENIAVGFVPRPDVIEQCDRKFRAEELALRLSQIV